MKDTDDEVRCRGDPEGGTGGLLNATGKRGMAAGRWRGVRAPSLMLKRSEICESSVRMSELI